MIKIDNSLLEEIGLGSLPEAEKSSFLKHVYETLEMRVGIRLADQMTNEQLDEFERYFEAKDDAGAFKWLETNFPNYKDIVQQEFDKLKAEVAQSAPQILAASQAQAANPGAAQPGQQPQMAAPSAPLPPQAPAAPANYATPAAPAPPQPYAAPEPPQTPPAPVPPQPQLQPMPEPLSPPVPPQPLYPAPPAPPSEPQPPQPQIVQSPPQYQPDFPAQQPPAGPGV
jgi:uncharacterized protein DUF5663